MNPEPTLTLEESFKQVMKTLPPPIRQYLQQGKHSNVANSLTTKYGLHIDQGGTLEREITLLLMGIESPDDFTQTLATEARLDQKIINGIVQDVNEQIFMPLREEMRKGAATSASPAPQPRPSIQHPPLQRPPVAQIGGVPRPPAPQQPRPQNVAPMAPRPANVVPPPNAAEPAHYFHLDNKIPPAPRMNPSIAPLPPKAILPNSRKLLQDHEESHIEFKKTAPPPPNLPGAMSPPPQTVSKPKVPPPPAKPYSTDPYREPVGGK